MPFKFSWLVELLEDLEDGRSKIRTTQSRADNPDIRVIQLWYRKYDDRIERTGSSAIAFLSCLFPERRPDRVYNVQETRLSQIFGRALGLGASRARDLNAWKTRDGADFPTCVERVMAQCEFEKPKSGEEVTLEAIDLALDRISTRPGASFSTANNQAKVSSIGEIISPIIHRLQSNEAKWLVRMIFKSYSPIDISEYDGLHGFHFMLPYMLTIQNSFKAAITSLGNADFKTIPPRPSKEYETVLRPFLIKQLEPKLGVMVKRQPFEKARSIAHCCKIVGKRIMSVERKYDGEYCQIHIDIESPDTIQIFSKSGKDSTNDRKALHGSVKESLRIGHTDCKIKQRCILEGELLVWSKETKRILPFHKIRKHVNHGGHLIGAEKDSPKSIDEQVMIIYYDILLLDDKLLLHESHGKRRSMLKSLIRTHEGQSQIVERCLVDFHHKHAPQQLREVFASAITSRWEGLVLKGTNDPYLSWAPTQRSIKLKKDYIHGLGDSADLCIVGGRRNARMETEMGLGKLTWTQFYIGCLINKDEVVRYDVKPLIRIIDVITHHSMSRDDILDLNEKGRLIQPPYEVNSTRLQVEHVRTDIQPPTELFSIPFIVEVMGAGYERPSSSNFYILRFPRKIGPRIKIHYDRDLSYIMSFDELQAAAKESFDTPLGPESQEDAKWISRLVEADPKLKYIQDHSQATTPSKTPKSCTTADLTPLSRRSDILQKSPTLVRMDTSELTLEEKKARYGEVRRDNSQRTESTATPTPGAMERYLKRPQEQQSPVAKMMEAREAKRLWKNVESRNSTGLAISPLQGYNHIDNQRQPLSVVINDSPEKTSIINPSRSISISDREVDPPILISDSGYKRGQGIYAQVNELVETEIYDLPPSQIFSSHREHSNNQGMMLTPPPTSDGPQDQMDTEKSVTNNVDTNEYDQTVLVDEFAEEEWSSTVAESVQNTPIASNEVTIGSSDALSEADNRFPTSETVLKIADASHQNRPETATRADDQVDYNLNKSDTNLNKAEPGEILSLPLHPPLLIGRSILTDKQILKECLTNAARSDTCFTLTTKHFVEDLRLRNEQTHQLAIKTRPLHALLIDSENTQKSLEDLQLLAGEILKQRRIKDNGNNSNLLRPLVLVFDHKVLDVDNRKCDILEWGKMLKIRHRPSKLLHEYRIDFDAWNPTGNKLFEKEKSAPIADDDKQPQYFCGVMDIEVIKGGGWAGNDAFKSTMKWDWDWVEENIKGGDGSGSEAAAMNKRRMDEVDSVNKKARIEEH